MTEFGLNYRGAAAKMDHPKTAAELDLEPPGTTYGRSGFFTKE
jgi:hypothetical protein